MKNIKNTPSRKDTTNRISKNYLKNAFTLIEVLVASLVLGVAVFGVLKLINNNMAQTNTFYKEKNKAEILFNIKQCVKNIGYDYFETQIGNTGSINFGDDNNKCLTGSFDENLNFTGIILGSGTEVRGDEFWSYVVANTGGTNYLNITSFVTDGRYKKELDFVLYDR